MKARNPALLSFASIQISAGFCVLTLFWCSFMSAQDPVTLSGAATIAFNGIKKGDAGANFITPNPDGAVGNAQYVQYVNDSYAVYSKTTGLQTKAPSPARELFVSLGTTNACYKRAGGDVVVKYDKMANRWVFSSRIGAGTLFDPYVECFAVSHNWDARGSYYAYQYALAAYNLFPDYPKLGVWPDGYYYSFNLPSGTGVLCALDRISMLSGASARSPQCFASGILSVPPTTLPADFSGKMLPPLGAPEYFIGLTGNFLALSIYRFHVDWTTPANSTLTLTYNPDVTGFIKGCNSAGRSGVCVKQSGTTQKLDAVGDRLMPRVDYRNFGGYESLAVTHTIQEGTGPYHTGLRWYEITNTGGTYSINQSGDIDPDSGFRWLGSIAQDKNADMLLGYSESSTAMYPAIAFTGRISTDPAGTMKSEQILLPQSGLGYQYTSFGDPHWGPSSSMTVDPGDDCTFWYTNSYIPAAQTGTGNWQTYIFAFKFYRCK